MICDPSPTTTQRTGSTKEPADQPKLTRIAHHERMEGQRIRVCRTFCCFISSGRSHASWLRGTNKWVCGGYRSAMVHQHIAQLGFRFGGGGVIGDEFFCSRISRNQKVDSSWDVPFCWATLFGSFWFCANHREGAGLISLSSTSWPELGGLTCHACQCCEAWLGFPLVCSFVCGPKSKVQPPVSGFVRPQSINRHLKVLGNELLPQNTPKLKFIHPTLQQFDQKSLDCEGAVRQAL